MEAEEPMQEPRGKAFGAGASRDQEIVDEFEQGGVAEDQLSAEPAHVQGSTTGEGRARQNREEDPPA